MSYPHPTYKNRSASVYKRPLPPKNIAKQNTLSFAAGHPTKTEVESESGRFVALWHIHQDEKYFVSADGFRMHLSENHTGKNECSVCASKDWGQFPDYEQIVPRNFKYHFIADALELRAAVVSCGIFAEEDKAVVKLYFYQDKLMVESNSEEFGNSSYEVQLKEDIGQGEGFLIGLNYRFLIDAIDHCSLGSGNVTLSVFKANSPIRMSGNTKTDNTAVIMPMHLG